jgi:hypothetical protein
MCQAAHQARLGVFRLGIIETDSGRSGVTEEVLFSNVLEFEENAQAGKQLIADAGLKNLLVGPLGFEPRTNGL